MMPSASGMTNGPPVEPRTPRAHFHSSTATIAPASAPAIECDRTGRVSLSVFSDPSSQAPHAPPKARLMK
jgi:hypothetical protein